MNAGLWLRTVRHLRPQQVIHRARLLTQRAVERRVPGIATRAVTRRVKGAVPGWPSGFVPLDAQVAPATVTGDTRLARYHLHYLDWAWTAPRDEVAVRWREWQATNRFPRGDAWHPYVASLRTWTLCWLGADSDGIALHAGYVRAHLESDVGGNHLIKNLKAIIGAGVYLGDRALVQLGIKRLATQLDVQILGDGGHYELSPSYHCQVLGDLIDIAGLADVPGLHAVIASMRSWLGAMLMPDGDVPLFNDCALVGLERIALLSPTRPRDEPLTVLRPSGYVVVRPDERLHAVIDVGPPCPDELPAHAHADCLSFELAVDGHRVIVDTGTSTYEPGARRPYERSTAAHNTVEIDGQDQTEVWATFRAARRARPTLESAAVEPDARVVVVASHNGYERLPGKPRHRRTFTAAPGRIEIIDSIGGTGTHTATARIHVATDAASAIGIETAPATTLGDAQVADGFDRLRPANVLVATVAGELPTEIRTLVTVNRTRVADA